MITSAGDDQEASEVLKVLSRAVPVKALSHVARAVGRQPDLGRDFRTCAIGFDSNVLINIAKGRSADVIDYLAEIHQGPLILPSQVLQEFWNNQVYAVSGLADQVRQRFKELEKLVQQIDPGYSELTLDLERRLNEFQGSFGHVLDERISLGISSLLNMLEVSAVQAELCRERLSPIGVQRKRAKTPPGFKDDGDGDFLVWADYLFGLQIAKREGRLYSGAVLVTDDAKKDWSTKGTTNPILAAEVMTLTAVPFESMSFDRFVDHVRQELAPNSPSVTT